MAGYSPTSPRRKRPPITPGNRYGRLTAVEFVGRNTRYEPMWRFRCQCGREVIIVETSITQSLTKSCGCLFLEMTIAKGHGNATHGKSRSVEYRTWIGMLARCQNPKNKLFRNYGSRGIEVCERWQMFENFFADMGSRPSPQHSIDRKNNNGDYEPGNCRWATPTQQSRNHRGNRIVVVDGVKMTFAEASEGAAVSAFTVRTRVKRGWSWERARNEPPHPNRFGKRPGARRSRRV